MYKRLLILGALLLSACQTAYSTRPTCKPEDQMAWNKARVQGTQTAYRTYLRMFPQGCYSAEAMQLLKKPVQPTPKVRPIERRTAQDASSRPY
jgi:hypothetical protein